MSRYAKKAVGKTSGKGKRSGGDAKGENILHPFTSKKLCESLLVNFRTACRLQLSVAHIVVLTLEAS